MSTARPIVLLLSGPNLNLLGTRQPEIYGTSTLDDHVASARSIANAAGCDLEHLQANDEGSLVDAVQAARNRCAAIVINAGALTHYAWSLADALSTFEGVRIELHLSNTHAREKWRHTSVIAPVVHGSVQGFGGHGYALAVEGALHLLGRVG
jgi:3-dehydroquinate dehydratase II